MLPDPLHPAVVHLPVALAVLMPLIGIGFLIAIQRGLLPARSWAAVVVFQFALALSAWAALETGHHEEERVERVVAERHIEEHEEAAERFLGLAAATALLTATGLFAGGLGRAGRISATAAMAIVLAAAVAAGHLGGQLVYRYGAASAYTEAKGSAPDAAKTAEPSAAGASRPVAEP